MLRNMLSVYDPTLMVVFLDAYQQVSPQGTAQPAGVPETGMHSFWNSVFVAVNITDCLSCMVNGSVADQV